MVLSKTEACPSAAVVVLRWMVPLPLLQELTSQVDALPSKLSRALLDSGLLAGVGLAVGMITLVGVATSGVFVCVAMLVGVAVAATLVAVAVAVVATLVAVAVLAPEIISSSIEAINLPLLKFWKIRRDVFEFAVKLKLISTH